MKNRYLGVGQWCTPIEYKQIDAAISEGYRMEMPDAIQEQTRRSARKKKVSHGSEQIGMVEHVHAFTHHI